MAIEHKNSKQVMFLLIYLKLLNYLIIDCNHVSAHIPRPEDLLQNSINIDNSRIDHKKSKTLHIGGLFPLTGSGGWLGGPGCLPAVNMALEAVNNRSDLLPGYYLHLTRNDSKVSCLMITYSFCFLRCC